MAVRSTDSQAARMRASIGAVFNKPYAFDKWAKKKFDKMAQMIADLIDNSLMDLGESVAERAKSNLEFSTPGGNTYQIIDKKGKVLATWKASSPGQMPAIFTSLLLQSIDFHVGGGGDRADFVEIGVFSDEEWTGVDGVAYRTIAFYGADAKHPYGRIVVDPSGTKHPVREYAKRLEGTGGLKDDSGERPFLRPAFEEIVMKQRKERQMKMKQIFTTLFGERVPVSFRIYVGKEYQKSGK